MLGDVPVSGALTGSRSLNGLRGGTVLSGARIAGAGASGDGLARCRARGSCGGGRADFGSCAMLAAFARTLPCEILPPGIGRPAIRLARRSLARSAELLGHIAVPVRHSAAMRRIVRPVPVRDIRA